MNPGFLNIFPSKKIKISIKKETQKSKIIIDYREKNSMIPTNLKKMDLNIEFRELKVADYIINNIAIERKTIDDFLSSMKNKRLVNQLEGLQQYQDRLLIIEGLEHQELYDDNQKGGIHPNAIRGFILSISLKYKTPIIFTKHQKDTAKFIYILSRKKEKENSLNVQKKSLNKKEQIQFILEGFPGIGPSTAKKLISKLKTMKNIFNATQEELKKIIGKKAEIFNLINEKG